MKNTRLGLSRVLLITGIQWRSTSCTPHCGAFWSTRATRLQIFNRSFISIINSWTLQVKPPIKAIAFFTSSPDELALSCVETMRKERNYNSCTPRLGTVWACNSVYSDRHYCDYIFMVKFMREYDPTVHIAWSN